MIALFVALGGVSYGLAGKNSVSSDDLINGQVKTKDIKNDGVKSKDIKNDGVKGKDVAPDTLTGEDVNENTLSKVPRSSEADRASNADNADNADALSGLPVTAFAPVTVVRWASINADGSIDPAESGGIAQSDVTHPSTGVYCIDTLDPAPRGVNATLRFGGSIGGSLFAEVNPTGAVVCAGSQVGIAAYNSGNVLANQAVTVVVY